MSTRTATPLGDAYRYVAEKFLELAAEADKSGLPELLTPDQVADTLKVHVETVYRMIRDGELEAKRVGKQYRIPADELRRLI